ncbi:hypothetical protein SAMN02745248_02439 [Hathewaya proteolytica DSM 3090]|uniref:Uncharacterized protein n=1 Tax=Hathewaya proteolytica DSM 3090 TaxID=1121331 RepID=A0A1M6S369_9CLOT|nr:hypothetical protein [Hathewaya proteolytica]SHK39111.1 hypothetical protein SAMN02745248_02439 [Hathewaya proteolytica DSM 3090]
MNQFDEEIIRQKQYFIKEEKEAILKLELEIMSRKRGIAQMQLQIRELQE